MLETEGKAKIISNPRITTADNKLARIIVGKKVPLVVSDEAGNAITQLTTIGIKLEVTPHINQDGRVTLDLFPEVSDLSQQATVQGGIIIVTSEAETRVIVKDGETAVIGGLIRTNESEVQRGVPILKDIPLLGYLFRSTNTVEEERELLIFVTPKIIRPDEA
jgi:type II secretory pathway component GspD/PulD (secretin)